MSKRRSLRTGLPTPAEMRIFTLASGSSGNCLLVTDGENNILIDAGISLRRIKTGISSLGLSPDDLSGVLVTHEHSDHISGLAMLVKKHEVPIYAPPMTAETIAHTVPGADRLIRPILPGEGFSLGDVKVTAFPTMHDTPDSVGYRLDGEISFGLCTDLGCVTDEVLDYMQGVHCAVIEANHDEEMLRYGSYPYYLKRRILSPRGHLSNEASGQLAVFLAQHGARSLVLGHLSRENNTPALAEETVRGALRAAGYDTALKTAPPAELLAVYPEDTYAESNAHMCGKA